MKKAELLYNCHKQCTIFLTQAPEKQFDSIISQSMVQHFAAHRFGLSKPLKWSLFILFSSVPSLFLKHVFNSEVRIVVSYCNITLPAANMNESKLPWEESFHVWLSCKWLQPGLPNRASNMGHPAPTQWILSHPLQTSAGLVATNKVLQSHLCNISDSKQYN